MAKNKPGKKNPDQKNPGQKNPGQKKPGQKKSGKNKPAKNKSAKKNPANNKPDWQTKFQEAKRFVIFTDIKGFSAVKEEKRQAVYRTFYRTVLPDLNKIITQYRKGDDKAVAFNTWGDGLMIVFESCKPAIEFMIEYRDFFRDETYFSGLDLPHLIPRIAGHYGLTDIFQDPLLDQQNITGEHVIVAARLEPVTRPGEIFVTEAFKNEVKDQDTLANKHMLYNLGELPLAKGFGKGNLFWLRHTDDPEIKIAPLMEKRLSDELPEPPKATEQEEGELQQLTQAENRQAFADHLSHSKQIAQPKKCSGTFLFKLAELCRTRGFYNEALTFLQTLDSVTIEADSLRIKPFPHMLNLLTLKSKCLSREGKYSQALEAIYGAWQIINCDEKVPTLLPNVFSDILSMLAAQYKRQALRTAAGGYRKKLRETDQDLLKRARNLYLEAFRRNLDDYYPAINAAYISFILGEDVKQEGIHLAEYILTNWPEPKAHSNKWWLAATLIEAEMLISGNYEVAAEKFAYAVKTQKNNWFDRQSTREQIESYGHIRKELPQIKPLLHELA